MSKSETKAQRLLQIQALLLSHPEGLSQSDIARRLNVNRSTVHRYLPDLTTHTPIFEEDGRLFIDRKSFLVNLQLNLNEALALHLATRLLTNRIERHNPHSASLLRKLSETIEKLSPQISRHISLSADIADDPSRFQDPHYLSVLETMALAWAEGRKVRIWHRHQETKKVYVYLFSIYFIEPYAVGYAIHAVGFREPPGSIRTFNLARIERIELSDQFYSIPKDFDPSVLLEQAWGIWYTDNEICEVKLLFSPQVADRVLETRWHPSQQTTLEADGSLTWEAEVAEPKEMIPWIRGWGSDCEVIAPLFLRNQMINEIVSLQRVYIKNQGKDYFQLWAKFQKGDETHWHALLWHMIDSAGVARLLWEDCLSESYKISLASTFDLSIEEAGKLLTFWVALHDIGKAGPEFQKKNLSRKQVLEGMDLHFPKPRTKVPGFHGTATTLILKRLFASNESSFPKEFRLSLAITLGGHHGEFPDNSSLSNDLLEDFHVGKTRWQTLQEQLYTTLKGFLNPPDLTTFPEKLEEINPLFLLIAGLTTTSDWLASNEKFFPFLNAEMDIKQYYEGSLNQAKKALTELGWYGWKSEGVPASFEELFPGFTPNAIQQAVISNCESIDSPFLAIIEAQTGSGKTEAALYLADTVIQRERKAGLYIAMPTQATSNQMHSRTMKFLSHRYSNDKINLHLVHGAAILSDQDQLYQPGNIWNENDLKSSNIQAHLWFLPRKRTLLAPFGVGTVDQTFQSVLQSRHFFVRLFGLSHKVVIFDEVHAYDVYMTRIFKTLLHWLHAIGTSVIILSATLPSSTRRELMEAYNASESQENDMAYPRISIASDHQSLVFHAGDVASHTVQLAWIDISIISIDKMLRHYLKEGGCAAVICNTVNRAQEVFSALKSSFGDDPVEIVLFHSRYPYCWRKEIEDRVLRYFGKETGGRPQKAIVVATQVIEQSLDLDFDFMITDLAPVDLLIQRIGRLHRHEHREDPPDRPGSLKEPICVIAAPEFTGLDVPEFGPDAYIYEKYFLFRTLVILYDREEIRLSEETDALIHAVYSNEKPSALSEKIWEAAQSLMSEMEKSRSESEQSASNYLIRLRNKPIFGCLQSSLNDDVNSLSKHVLVAPTRDFSPSVQIVCLIRDETGVHPVGDPTLIDLEKPIFRHQEISCLRAAATVNHWGVLNYLFSQQCVIPEAFKDSSILHHHYPIIFENGKCELGDWALFLDEERGLSIRKREE
jgi:CRISPR-associated endonuclease/helicase Cas3